MRGLNTIHTRGLGNAPGGAYAKMYEIVDKLGSKIGGPDLQDVLAMALNAWQNLEGSRLNVYSDHILDFEEAVAAARGTGVTLVRHRPARGS